MSAQQSLILLQQLSDNKLSALAKKNPALAKLAQVRAPDLVINQDSISLNIPPSQLKKSEKKIFTQLSQDEKDSVFTTLQSWLTTPFESPEPTMKLYIEQQLSSLTGFNVCSENGSLVFPLLQTVMSAMPHIKRSPQDSIDQHFNRSEAGIARDRSFFGWINNPDRSSSQSEEEEKYGLYLPLHLLSNWQDQRDNLISLYKKINILVCNPFTKSLVVAKCIGWWPPSASHPTSGGTPELITAAQVWHPNSLGRVVLFIISADNSDLALNLGPISLSS